MKYFKDYLLIYASLLIFFKVYGQKLELSLMQPLSDRVLERLKSDLDIECDSIVLIDTLKLGNSICEYCKKELYKFEAFKKNNIFLGALEIVANEDSLFLSIYDYTLFTQAKDINPINFADFRNTVNKQLKVEIKIPKNYFIKSSPNIWIDRTIGMLDDFWLGKKLYSSIYYCLVQDVGWTYKDVHLDESVVSIKEIKKIIVPEGTRICIGMTINAKPNTNYVFSTKYKLIRRRQILFNPKNFQVLFNTITSEYMIYE
jgi:hypothetical protein